MTYDNKIHISRNIMLILTFISDRSRFTWTDMYTSWSTVYTRASEGTSWKCNGVNELRDWFFERRTIATIKQIKHEYTFEIPYQLLINKTLHSAGWILGRVWLHECIFIQTAVVRISENI